MIRGLLILVGVLFAGLLCLIGTTWAALEWSGVVVVHTGPGEPPRATHVWYVQRDGELLLEAGHPDNPWVRDLEAAATQGLTTLQLSGEGLDGRYDFKVDTSADGHARIRRLMGEKYGWRDLWIGLLFDTSQSQLVTLSPR